jgi:hypothetical protein
MKSIFFRKRKQTTFMQGTTEVLSIASTSAKGKGLELVILDGIRLIHDWY